MAYFKLMQMSYSKEQLNNIFDTLPEDLKNAIASVDNSKTVNELGNKYKLHVDQQSILGYETGLVLLGVTDPTDFVSILSTKLGIDRNMASQIAGEINERIFVKVKSSLRSLNQELRIRPARHQPDTDDISAGDSHSGENHEYTNTQNINSTTTNQEQRREPSPAIQNLVRSVEAEKLNVPKQAMDILQGNVMEEKKNDMNVLGFEPTTKMNNEVGIKNNEYSNTKKQETTSPWTENKNPETFAQKPTTMGEMNILEDKLKAGVNIEGEETELVEKKTIGKVVDPYKETI